MYQRSLLGMLMIGLLCFFVHGNTAAAMLENGIASECVDQDQVYYVSPTGADTNPGTCTAPWKSLRQVSNAVKAGDTIIFLPGTYPGTLNPKASGTADAPIRFLAAERMTVRLVGGGPNTYAVRLSDVSHIHLAGFQIEAYWEQPTFSAGKLGYRVLRDGYWIMIERSSHIQIVDILMENALAIATTFPLHIADSQHIQVQDSIIRRVAPALQQTERIPSDVVRVLNSSHILFAGNSFGRSLHTTLAFLPDDSNSFITLRGNVFHAEWGRNFEFFGVDHVLFENNLVTDSVKGSWGGSNSKLAVNHGIFRFNQVINNPGGAVHIFPFRDVQIAGVRLYHNVFDHNGDYGMQVSTRQAVRDVVFTNNVFFRNDVGGSQQQLVLNGASTVDEDQAEPGMPLVLSRHIDQQTVTVQANVMLQTDQDGAPGFVDANAGDYSLLNTSQLRDAGQPLTYTRTSGSGTYVDVVDATYFYDGFGMAGEQGDLIMIGTSIARIVAIDLPHQSIELDRDLTWSTNTPVSLAFSGTGPDIGIYEHGDQGRAAVQVRMSASRINPGEAVVLEAVVRGEVASPLAYWWMFADGSIDTRPSLERIFTEPGRYPVRLRVTDATGHTLYGTGYIVVEEMDSAVLFKTTFDANDVLWWTSWIMHRPAPVVWERTIELDGQGYLAIQVAADTTAAAMPAWIYPSFWHIDDYPMIHVRYRMVAGTPVALYLQAFGGRRVVFAATTTHRDSKVARVGQNVLVDDGAWHTLTVDARHARQVLGDIFYLEAMGFQTGSVPPASPSLFYHLDEVVIGRE